MSGGPYLTVGMGFADYLDLTRDGVYTYPSQRFSSGGGASLPAGVSFGEHVRGVYAQRGQQPADTQQITMGVICMGADMVSLEHAFHAVLQKLEQARDAGSDQPSGTPVYFAWKRRGADPLVFWRIVDGTFPEVPNGMVDSALYKFGVLTLWVRPEALGSAIIDPASATLVNGAPASVLYRAGVPGDVESLVRLTLTDVAANYPLQRFLVGVRHAQPLPAGAFTPIYAVTPSGAGVALADPTAIGGTCARLPAGAISDAFQEFGRVTAASGGHQNARYTIYGVLRDATVPLQAPRWPSQGGAVPAAGGGSLAPGSYAAVLTEHDGSGNESFPTASQFVTVGVSSTAFADGFESGDFSAWDSVYSSTGSVPASLTVDAAAAYAPSGSTEGLLGLHVQSGVNNAGSGAAWLVKAIPGGGTTGYIRFKLFIKSSSNTATDQIVLCTTGGAALAWLQNGGSGWEPAVFGSGGAALGGGTGIPQGQWVTVELGIVWGGGTPTVTVWVNDQGAGASVTHISGLTAPDSMVVGGTGDGLEFYADNVQVSNSRIGANQGSVAYTWTPGAGGTGQYLYVQYNDLSWRRIDVGTGSSYALTSGTAGSLVAAPPTGLPAIAPAQLRLAAAVAGTHPAWQPLEAVSAHVLGGAWELLRLAEGVPLPPQPQAHGRASLLWQLRAEAKRGSQNSPNLDLAALILLAEDEAGVILTAPGAALTQHGVWVLDQNADGLPSCTIYAPDGVTVIGAATVTGELSYGPGDTVVTILAERADAGGRFVFDAADSRFTAQATLTPRFVTTRAV